VVRLELIEGMDQCLHQLVLCSQKLLHLLFVGIVGLSAASLAVVVVVPHVNHQKDFL
jgi:hypothetical protein